MARAAVLRAGFAAATKGAGIVGAAVRDLSVRAMSRVENLLTLPAVQYFSGL
jgi:hypothetical protein